MPQISLNSKININTSVFLKFAQGSQVSWHWKPLPD